jgi:hypothetical protein
METSQFMKTHAGIDTATIAANLAVIRHAVSTMIGNIRTANGLSGEMKEVLTEASRMSEDIIETAIDSIEKAAFITQDTKEGE